MLSSEYEKEPITNYFYNLCKEGSAHAIYIVVAVVHKFFKLTPFHLELLAYLKHRFATLRTHIEDSH